QAHRRCPGRRGPGRPGCAGARAGLDQSGLRSTPKKRNSMNLQNQVALVTGASRGIGKAIALELARQGAKVVGTATSAAGAEAIGAYLAEFGGKGVVLNVTDAAQ